VVGMAESADAPGDLLALPTKALGLSARSLRFLGDLFQTCGGLWGPPWATLFKGIAGGPCTCTLRLNNPGSPADCHRDKKFYKKGALLAPQ
jgi:hypothetical protein